VGLLVIYPLSSESLSNDALAASREVLFVTGINDFLPVGVRGLMLTGLLAALASTIDTHLNWGASYWSNDIYQRLICKRWLERQPKRKELVVVARLSNILILTIAFIIMANLGSIQTAWYISLLFGAGMGSVLILRWIWERINLYSELAAIVTSLVVAPVLLVVTDQEYVRLGMMSLISTIAVVSVTLITPRTTDVVLKRFYNDVRPLGFWRRTAVAAGGSASDPVKRLLKSLRTTALTSASLFLALVGLGKLLVPSPGESILLPALSLLTALVLVPVWWRDAFREHKPVARG
jgi:Na+/proline symporter